MSHISLRVTEEEKNLIESYAKLQAKSVSEVLKNAFFERLEDEFDLAAIREYESRDDHKYYTLEQIVLTR